MARAWTFQDTRAKRKHGNKAPWSVGWIDPDGIRHSKKIGSKSMADKFARKREGELAAGTYEKESRISWADFRQQYQEHCQARKRPSTVEVDRTAFDHFERVIRPGRLSAVTTATIERYVDIRSQERVRGGLTVSPGTINRELRSLRAALRKALKWDLIGKAPVFEMLKETRPRPQMMPDEDFAALYRNCGAARRPRDLSIPAAEWWQALLIFARYTGWRRGEILALKWDDVDLEPDENGEYWATTQAPDNKGGRTERVPLLPIVVQHLRPIRTFGPMVFPWKHSERLLYPELERIAEAAGVKFPSNGRREDKFHALRKTFGTKAALAGIDRKALTALMRHKDYSTTERYYLDAEALMAQAVGQIEVSRPIREAVG